MGHSVHVCEVASYFCNVENVDVAEPAVTKNPDIGLDQIRRVQSELDCVRQHRKTRLAEVRRRPVSLDTFQQFVIFEEAAQTAPVVGYSVVTPVGLADDQRDQFALNLAQRLCARHRRVVQGEVRIEALGVERVDRHDLVNPTVGLIDNRAVQLAEFAIPFVVGDRLYPCHYLFLLFTVGWYLSPNFGA